MISEMIRYSIQPRDRIFVKGYRIFVFCEKYGKNIGKNINKNLSGKYSQKRLDHAKKFAQMYLKTFQKY